MFDKQVKILIIDDNSSFVLSVLRSFSGYPNIKIYVLLAAHSKPGYFRHSRYIEQLYHYELTGENFEVVVKDCIKMSGADLIISTREWISKLLYQYKNELEKYVRVQPVSDMNTFNTVFDKWNLNKWLEENDFPFARVVDTNVLSKECNIADYISFPFLLKPLTGTGGIGIKLIKNTENFEAALSESKDSLKNYFIQEYIEGYDIGINIYSVDGMILCHTIQKGLFQGQLTFSRGTEFIRNQQLLDLTTEIIKKLNYSGVANLDLRYSTEKGTFVLVDFNARFWSTLDGSTFMGVNFPVLIAAHSLGVKFDFPDYSTGTYYCANAAVKTIIKNVLPGEKLPINIRHTKLTVIAKDPAPEIVHAGELLLNYFKKLIGKN